ncbi:hypothetical protein BD410DRAFT_714891 [Rickenella mellea]|uniref:Vacuolar protein-sorting-associated protein 36 n=1 Tax=Rickenella mellea TaxID=50990 RepID=A0A4Y7QJ67_9AGAM|nr:hypothetical protein BD410DRAFT_714891 [Rickenella mellea]
MPPTILNAYAKPVDNTIPVQALLYDDETLHASQDSVGLYDGPSKSAPHQSGTIHVTSHRIFFIADGGTPSNTLTSRTAEDESVGASLALDLAHVTQTEYYAGFLKSSAKITLHLTPPVRKAVQPPSSATTTTSSTSVKDFDDPFSTWECEICGNKNPPGLSPAARSVCALCGVPRSAVSLAAGSTPAPSRPLSVLRHPPDPTSTSASWHSRSLPSSAAHTPPTGSPAPSRGSIEEVRGVGQGSSKQVECPACTFLNHPYLRECEICGTALPSSKSGSSSSASKPGLTLSSKSAPTSRPTSPVGDVADLADGERYIKLSFRKGGDKPFYAVLKRTLKTKAWEVRIGYYGRRTNTGESSATTATARSGISGILQNVESSAMSTSTDMSHAFQDLEALMVKAQEMVKLAAELNERLSAAQQQRMSVNPYANANGAGVVEPEEATFIRSSLAQLGLQMKNAPVTQDMVKDERRWVEQLAKELAGVLQGDSVHEGMMRQRGIMGVDEAWGGWNRARGVALIPPTTLLQTLPLLPAHTSPPINTRKLTSGLTVLHMPPYAHTAFSVRFVGRIESGGPCTTVTFAQEEGLSVGLADEMIRDVERDGGICRDEVRGSGGMTAKSNAGAAEIRWWVNMFTGYVWDGQLDEH